MHASKVTGDSLVAHFCLKGVTSKLSEHHHNRLVERLTIGLLPVMKKPGHRLDLVFRQTAGNRIEPPSFSSTLTISSTQQSAEAIEVIRDRHERLISVIGDELSDFMLMERVAVSLGTPDDYLHLNLDSNDSIESSSFDDLDLILGPNLPWQMNLSIYSGFDHAGSILARKTRPRRWLKALTGIDKLSKYEKSLMAEEACYAISNIVGHELSFLTWGSDPRNRQRNKILLESALSNTVYATLGDVGIMTLDRAVWLLPMCRLGSPWPIQNGGIAFANERQERLCFEPLSRLQRNWCELVVDPTGLFADQYRDQVSRFLGKSPAMLGRDVSVRLSKAPYASRLGDRNDYLPFSLDCMYVINILDTPLGLQHPTERVVSDLAALIRALLDEPVPTALIHHVAQLLADEVFAQCSFAVNPKAYCKGVIDSIDDALAGQPLPETWWDASQQLLESGEEDGSIRAHRQAMPTVSDVVQLLRSSKPLSRSGLGYDLEQLVLSALSGLPDTFKCFALPTNTRLDHKRLTIDIDEERTYLSMSRSRAHAIQYLLARKMATEGLYGTYSWGLPDVFQGYWRRQRQGQSTVGRVNYLDLDAVIHQQAVFDAITLDVREASMNALSIHLEAKRPDYWVEEMLPLVGTQIVFAPDQLLPQDRQHLRHFPEELLVDTPRMSSSQVSCAFSASLQAPPWNVAQVLFLEPEASMRTQLT